MTKPRYKKNAFSTNGLTFKEVNPYLNLSGLTQRSVSLITMLYHHPYSQDIKVLEHTIK